MHTDRVSVAWNSQTKKQHAKCTKQSLAPPHCPYQNIARHPRESDLACLLPLSEVMEGDLVLARGCSICDPGARAACNGESSQCAFCCSRTGRSERKGFQHPCHPITHSPTPIHTLSRGGLPESRMEGDAATSSCCCWEDDAPVRPPKRCWVDIPRGVELRGACL